MACNKFINRAKIKNFEVERELDIPNEADVDAETPVHGGAIDAKEDTICNRSPHRILRVAVEAHLKQKEEEPNDQIWKTKL